jgi:hypothetical protein
MECTDKACDFIHIALDQKPGCQLLVQLILLLKAAHADRIFDNLPVISEPQLTVLTAQGGDVEIEAWRQAPVEAHFFLAVVLPVCQAGEVKESEVNRFLDLVGKLTREQDPGDVGFDQLDSVSFVRVALGRQKRLDR